jgi:predicted metal-dependent peptidase
MIYNPEFLGSLPEHHVAGVLKHEMYHLIFEHCVSRKPEGECRVVLKPHH